MRVVCTVSAETPILWLSLGVIRTGSRWVGWLVVEGKLERLLWWVRCACVALRAIDAEVCLE